VATALPLWSRYAQVGRVTQRLFETVLAGCLPLIRPPFAALTGFHHLSNLHQHGTISYKRTAAWRITEVVVCDTERHSA
jgi:hypothetical protein